MPKISLYLPFEVVGRVLGGVVHGIGDGIHVLADAVTPDAPVQASDIQVLPEVDQGMGDQSPQSLPPLPLGPRSYIVRDGEYLSDIAARELGRADRWREIMSLNNLADSRKIKAGDTILLPA